jgi:glycosyltransferase involved in cell wall biosynthesis
MNDLLSSVPLVARDVSVVLPIYNEEESLPAMIEGIHDAMDPTGMNFEIVCIDDGSSDRSFEVLLRLATDDPRLVIGRFRRNFGQTAAMQAGIDRATGTVIVTMDSDLQNDPRDIPRMIDKLDEGYDLVTGWRVDRKDAFLNRRLPSFLANILIARTTGIRLHDYGCSLKVMRAELAKELRLYGEMHRFVPVMASLIGARIAEVEVNHRPRQHGESKYGIGRTVRVTLDLLTVLFLQSYLARPMQVFGLSGLVCLFLGFGVSAYLTFQKLAFGAELADRPLLLLGVILILVGVQLVSLGLVAEVLGRTYHEAQGKRPYHVREWVVGAEITRAAPSDQVRS